MQTPLFKIRQGQFFGFMNHTGEVVIEPQYLYVDEYRNGFTRVRLNDLLVHMDQQGRLLLKRMYKQIGTFEQGLSRVRLVQHWGFINLEHKLFCARARAPRRTRGPQPAEFILGFFPKP